MGSKFDLEGAVERSNSIDFGNLEELMARKAAVAAAVREAVKGVADSSSCKYCFSSKLKEEDEYMGICPGLPNFMSFVDEYEIVRQGGKYFGFFVTTKDFIRGCTEAYSCKQKGEEPKFDYKYGPIRKSNLVEGLYEVQLSDEEKAGKVYVYLMTNGGIISDIITKLIEEEDKVPYGVLDLLRVEDGISVTKWARLCSDLEKFRKELTKKPFSKPAKLFIQYTTDAFTKNTLENVCRVKYVDSKATVGMAPTELNKLSDMIYKSWNEYFKQKELNAALTTSLSELTRQVKQEVEKYIFQRKKQSGWVHDETLKVLETLVVDRDGTSELNLTGLVETLDLLYKEKDRLKKEGREQTRRGDYNTGIEAYRQTLEKLIASESAKGGFFKTADDLVKSRWQKEKDAVESGQFMNIYSELDLIRTVNHSVWFAGELSKLLLKDTSGMTYEQLDDLLVRVRGLFKSYGNRLREKPKKTNDGQVGNP